MNKFIFLDIDGVMNNQIWYEESRKVNKDKYQFEKHEHSQFDPRCVELLNSITDKTGAKIVVSSSWRIGMTVKELQDLFEEVGITGEVIDKTPRLSFSEGGGYSVPRGCEIKAWLENNKGILGNKMTKVPYVILDDDSDMLWWQRHNFFHVDPYAGLTSNIAYKVINYLTP